MNVNVFRNLSYGLYIISAIDGTRPTGCTANSAMQITSSPATIAISINHDNFTNKCIKESKQFAISILGEQADPSLIGTFGFQSGKDTDKFAEIDFKYIDGLPIVKDACGFITCKVINTMETKTHTVFLGEVEEGDIMDSDNPMTYAYYHKVIKGKSPKNAPTYIPDDEEVDEQKSKDVYVCGVCGYEYTKDTPFDELPEDYTCPICGQPKSVFKKK